jgi:methionine sulfoxide reductase heme-binding subunit
VMTAALEFAWYSLATKVNPWRVIAANESIARGLRPAHWVLVVTASLIVVFVIRRRMRTRQPMRRAAA